jgi:hypothetical protein
LKYFPVGENMAVMRLSTRIGLALLAAVLTLSLDPVQTLRLGRPSLTSAQAKRHRHRKPKKQRVRHRHRKHRKQQAPPPTEM